MEVIQARKIMTVKIETMRKIEVAQIAEIAPMMMNWTNPKARTTAKMRRKKRMRTLRKRRKKRRRRSLSRRKMMASNLKRRCFTQSL